MIPDRRGRKRTESSLNPSLHLSPGVKIVLCGHTLFRKRGKGSGNFFYSSLLPRTVECGTNHSAVFCHMSAVITTSIGNYKV